MTQLMGLLSFLENIGILVYPNPTKNTLTIQLPFKKAEALIYYLRGKLVQQYFVEEGKNKIELNLQTGSYIVQFRFDNKLITQKIIVLP
ncbi:MAG: T9SS type A sorting domain-containing protein [Chitinophagales bacterium]